MIIRKNYLFPRLFVAVIICFYAVNIQGQAPANFSFSHITTSNGLLNNNIHSIVQDEEGYIWLGTLGGLQRYDGTRFKTFRTNGTDSCSLPTNIVRQLMLDKKQNLWVLLDQGRVGRFDTKKFRFRESKVRVQQEASVRSSLQKLVTDEQGRVFLLFTGNELLLLNEDSNTFEPAGQHFNLPDSIRPADFTQQPGTPYYWIALQDGHIAVYNSQTKQLNTRESHEPALSILDTYDGEVHPASLFFDSKHRLWFEAWGPVFRTCIVTTW